MDQQIAIDKLATALPLLPEKDQGFANSLIKNYRRYKKLSPKQLYWVGRLTENATRAEDGPAMVDNAANLFAHFDAAASKMKFPKLVINLEEGGKLRLNLAGPTAKFPGTLNVTDGKPFGANVYYGRLLRTGEFKPGYSTEASQRKDMVLNTLEQIAADPAGFAKTHGKMTNTCCFCNATLEQENSVKAGFGPVCGANWGLLDEWKAAVGHD